MRGNVDNRVEEALQHPRRCKGGKFDMAANLAYALGGRRSWYTNGPQQQILAGAHNLCHWLLKRHDIRMKLPFANYVFEPTTWSFLWQLFCMNNKNT